MESILAVDPITRYAIKQDCNFTSVEDIMDPSLPSFCETLTPEDVIKTAPANTVKSLVEVKFQHNCGGISFVTAMEEVSSICKIVCNTAANNKTRLVIAHE